MKFRTIPNFRLIDLSLYHMIVLLGCGAFVLRARTPSLHQRVVLHDKGPGDILPPRDVILAHEIIAQRRSVSKAQRSVRLLERHLFDEIERPVLRRQKYANMPDKQQRSLLGRLIMEEYRDEAYSLAVAEAHAALSPLRLHGTHMAPDLRAVLRFHGGIQRAEIVQTAPAQCLRIGLQRFLVHKQHILARVEVGVLTI